jgi:hypothetical protein
MIGEHRFRNREILMTTTCMLNSRPHWHASIIEDETPVSSRSVGQGMCLTTPAAWLWVITGFRRKSWGST